MLTELMTASRMSAFLTCPRKHYYRYELGLASLEKSPALRFGSAWHAALEAREKGCDIDAALDYATREITDLQELEFVKLGTLLTGYYNYYANDALIVKYPEVEFCLRFKGSRKFHAAGKVDGLGEFDGRLGLIERKTTGESINSGSSYWDRLEHNPQILQYVWAARKGGWDISAVFYDVTHKTTMAPYPVTPIEKRKFKKDGAPYASTRLEDEPLDEYADRLAVDIASRPEHYFARKEIPILDSELEAFQTDRLAICRNVISIKREARKMSYHEDAWPRHVGRVSCNMCEYQSFCLRNERVNGVPPQGFKYHKPHEELSDDATTTPAA